MGSFRTVNNWEKERCDGGGGRCVGRRRDVLRGGGGDVLGEGEMC